MFPKVIEVPIEVVIEEDELLTESSEKQLQVEEELGVVRVK